MTNGYMGKILWVDLTKGQITEEVLDEKMLRDYIGGYGIGARILFSRQKAGIDPLGPENILGFMTGPFTGTQALGGSRYSVVAKSPLTGTWGDANSGGNFGPGLKFAGFDGVFFTGQSDQPVYLFIDDGKAEIRNAAKLWGKDCYETEDLLKIELGKDVEVACIGPAGEALSLISSVINNKGRAAARSGLGAVMGSKKLKAIAVKGDREIPVAGKSKIAELRKKYTNELGGPSGLFKQFGTPGLTIGGINDGDTPIRNWALAGIDHFPQVEKVGGNSIIDRQQKKYGCFRCVIACGGHMKEGTGEYRYAAGIHKPEYETIGMFGPNLLNDNADSLIKINDVCNRFGVDTISAGACIAFTIECYENSLITKKDTDDLEMTWGNHKSIVAMLEKLVRREGFGDVIADGVKKASERIGQGSDRFAMHINGQEYPAHNPKFAYQFASSYRMDATPGRHTRNCGGIPRDLPYSDIDLNSWSGRGMAQKINLVFNHTSECAGCCLFVSGSYPLGGVLIEFLNAITGWDYTVDDLLKTGERIADIRHVFNIREGLNPLKYKNPDRMVGKPPMQDGPLAGITLDEDTIAREFCEAMDWDLKTTRPSDKKLLELGMADVVKSI